MELLEFRRIVAAQMMPFDRFGVDCKIGFIGVEEAIEIMKAPDFYKYCQRDYTGEGGFFCYNGIRFFRARDDFKGVLLVPVLPR